MSVIYLLWFIIDLILFSVVKSFDSLWPHGLQYTRLPCPSLSPGICSNSCPLSWWCCLTITSSATLLSFCLQSYDCIIFCLPGFLFSLCLLPWASRPPWKSSILPLELLSFLWLDLQVSEAGVQIASSGHWASLNNDWGGEPAEPPTITLSGIWHELVWASGEPWLVALECDVPCTKMNCKGFILQVGLPRWR